MRTRQPGDPVPGETIREVRRRYRLSQDELARRLGIKGGKSVISGWENGHSTCEGPVAELLLLLFGENPTPAAALVLQEAMDAEWRRAGTFIASWRQISAAPTSAFEIDSTSFASLFPGVEIPHEEHAHGFPFIDHELPREVYGRSERWVGVIPVEKERPPAYLWMLGRDAAFSYRENLWEEQPTSITGGQTHVGSLLHLALALTFFLQRLFERLSPAADLQFHLQMDLEGMANRGVASYRLDRPFPDVSLTAPDRKSVENHVSGWIKTSAHAIATNPLGIGLELTSDVVGRLRPEIASRRILEEQLRRRHVEDVRLGTSIRFLGFLDRILGRRPRKGIVSLRGTRAGILEETITGSRFTYDPHYLRLANAVPLSPTLPLDPTPYDSVGLHPYFANLLPEGWRLDEASRSRSLDKNDRFGILLALGDAIVPGAVEIHPAGETHP